MQLKKWMLASTLMLTFAKLAVAQEMTIIKGEVHDDLQGYKKVYLYGKGRPTDSTEIVNGSFEFKIPYVKSFIPLLYDEYSFKKLGGMMVFPILVTEPGTVEIKDIDITHGVSSGKISGMTSAVEFQQFGNLQNEAMKEINAELEKKYGGIPAYPRDGKITPQMEAFMRDQQELSEKKMPAIIENFIKSHPNSYVSLMILDGAAKNSLPPADLQRLYNTLPKKLQQLEEGRDIVSYLSALTLSETGKTVADFTLNDAREQAISFKGLKGKYVLIDFWASWCGPCKASFPYVKEIYKKYKDKNFEIYSISTDKDKAAWLKELKAQQLPWLSALDTKNIATERFAISAVPTTYLIDPEGKIVMKEVGFSQNGAIEKKLAELLGN